MTEFYASAQVTIREDLTAAHARAWERIGNPGTWWDGAQRVAIAAEAGIYPVGRPAANIMKAMSLVPDEVRSFFDIVSHQYQGPLEMRDVSHEYRAISHAQIELLAARVSALNQCLY